jgi:hypothetical protein
MESTDLTPSPSDERRLELLLRQANPMIPDHGFAQRVLNALPPKRQHLRQGVVRAGLCIAGAAIGAAVAWQQGVDLRDVPEAIERFAASSTSLQDAWSVPAAFATHGHWVLVSLGVTAVSLLFAFQPRSWRRWT